jgi:hypothetical protein
MDYRHPSLFLKLWESHPASEEIKRFLGFPRIFRKELVASILCTYAARCLQVV